MAGRPPLPPGTPGKVRFVRAASGTGWRARCNYRDVDGVTRAVERSGASKAQASRRLAEAVRDRVHTSQHASLTSETRLAVVIPLWFESATHLSASTRRQYGYTITNHVLPAVGSLRVRELTPGRVHEVLDAVREKTGIEAAKSSRTVLSSVCTFLVQRDVMERNPVREIGRMVSGTRKKPVQALDPAEVRTLRTYLTYDRRAQDNGVAALIDFMLATGLRLSEAMAVRWCDLDLGEGIVKVTGNLVKLKGEGITRMEVDSNKLTIRALTLPQWEVEQLRTMKRGKPDDPVFPKSLAGGWRDASNTQTQLKAAFVFAGFPSITSHTLRKSCASTLDRANLTASEVSFQLGHSQTSTTQDYYIARKGSDVAAQVLEAFSI